MASTWRSSPDSSAAAASGWSRSTRTFRTRRRRSRSSSPRWTRATITSAACGASAGTALSGAALRERITRIRMTDQGCMMRAYSRDIVAAINSCREVNTFIPALAYTFAQHPTEIEVAHEERAAGDSKYSLYSLVRLNFDLVTGFSVMPLQLFSLSGIAIALLSLTFVIFLAIRRLVVGPEAEGVFTLFGIAFFLIGITLFGIGLLGEYVGRIYEQVRQRPRYLVQAVLERKNAVSEPPKQRQI